MKHVRTRGSYERVFGKVAPKDIWPGSAQRLSEDPNARRVHPRDGWIVRKRTAVMVAAGVLVSSLIRGFHLTKENADV